MSTPGAGRAVAMLALALVSAATFMVLIPMSELSIGADSASFVGAAAMLVQYGAFSYPYPHVETWPDPLPMACWPPGYPLAIAGLIPFVGSPIVAAYMLSVAGYAALAPLSFLLFRRVTGSDSTAALLVLAIVLSPNLLVTAASVNSEALFLPVVLAGLLLLLSLQASPAPSLRTAVLLGAVGLVAILLRWIAIPLIITMVPVYLLAANRRSRVVALRLAVSAAPAILFYGFSTLRNQHLPSIACEDDRSLHIVPNFAWDFLGEVQRSALSFAVDWLYHPTTVLLAHPAITMVTLVLAIGVGTLFWRMHRGSPFVPAPEDGRPLVTLALFSIIYVGTLAALKANDFFSAEIGRRLLSPMFVPALAVVVGALVLLLHRAHVVAGRMVLCCALVLFVAQALVAITDQRPNKWTIGGVAREPAANAIVAHLRNSELPIATPYPERLYRTLLLADASGYTAKSVAQRIISVGGDLCGVVPLIGAPKSFDLVLLARDNAQVERDGEQCGLSLTPAIAGSELVLYQVETPRILGD